MGTDIVAIVNALIDVVKEVFDSSPKLRRSAYQRSRYELTRAGQRRLTDGYTVTHTDVLGNLAATVAAGAADATVAEATLGAAEAVWPTRGCTGAGRGTCTCIPGATPSKKANGRRIGNHIA